LWVFSMDLLHKLFHIYIYATSLSKEGDIYRLYQLKVHQGLFFFPGLFSGSLLWVSFMGLFYRSFSIYVRHLQKRVTYLSPASIKSSSRSLFSEGLFCWSLLRVFLWVVFHVCVLLSKEGNTFVVTHL